MSRDWFRGLLSLAAAGTLTLICLGPVVSFWVGLVDEIRRGRFAWDDPIWPILEALLTIVWVGLLVWIGVRLIAHRVRQARAERQYDLNSCEHCGYDLRVDSDRCPECGRFRLFGRRRRGEELTDKP